MKRQITLSLLFLNLIGCTPSLFQDSQLDPPQNTESPDLVLAQTSTSTVKEEDLITTYYFNKSQSSLDLVSKKLLISVATYLKSNPQQRIIIIGHTDIHGSHEYNLTLGQQRAIAVSSYLESQGVQPLQMTTLSKGKESVISLTNNDQAQSLNRRVEIIFENE